MTEEESSISRSPKIRHKSGYRGKCRAPLSAARPGRIIWSGLSRSSSGDGHQRGCYRAAVTLAESLCRAPHRLDPPRMFGSHHHLERVSPAQRPVEVFSIPSQDQNASLAKQGSSAASPHTTSLCRQDCCVPGGRNIAPSELLWRPNRRTCFGARGRSFLQSLGCNGAQNPCMVPKSQQRPMFYSTNQKSSVAIFIGKPIPRSDRFLRRHTEREQGNEGGKNCDHAHDGMAVARKSLDFLDLSEF